MLEIWIGLTRSGKSEKILEKMKERKGEAPQLLIVPEPASHQAEVDLCRAFGDDACRYAEVVSFRLLSQRVLSATGGLAEYTLDKGGKLLVMQRALQEISGRLKVYGRSTQKVAFLESLVSLTDEFHSYDIDPATFSAASDEAGEKVKDIALIYGTYEGKLCTTLSDRRDRLRKLVDRLAASGYIDGKDVYLDGFSYFNGLEEKAIAILLRRARSVTVTLLGDKTGKSDGFAVSLRVRDRLLRLAQDTGVKSRLVFVENDADSPFDHIERQFFRRQEVFQGAAADSIHVLRANTPFSEVEMAAAEIRRLIQSGAYRYRDITVVARNMAEYEAAIESVFERYDVPVFCNARSDILEKPALSVLLSALDAVNNRFEYEDMFRYLKTGFAGVSAAECDELENYVIRWDIRGNMWLREEPWSGHPDGYSGEWREEDHALLARINSLRDTIRHPLKLLMDALNSNNEASCKVKALYDFSLAIRLPEQLQDRAELLVEQGNNKLAEEYGQLWSILCNVLDQFYEILGESELSNEEFVRLLRLVLTQYDIGTIPVSLDQVSVGDVGRNDRHPIKVLFLLGANDHILPNVDSNSGLLNEEERDILSQRGIRLAPTGLDQFHVELQDIHQILSRPEEKLYVSYPMSDIAGSELRPSFVVERLLKLFDDVTLTVEEPGKSYRLTAYVPALEAAGEQPGGALWRYFADRGEGVLFQMERAASIERGRLSRVAVRSLYGEQIRMSASRMDAVGQCHFAYFMQYGLQAKERSTVGLDAPEIGTFVHYLLEKVFRDIAEQDAFSSIDEKAIDALVRRYIQEYIDSRLGDLRDHTARFSYLFNRLCRTAASIVKNAVAEIRESDFRPVAFELSFANHGDLPAITIEEAGAKLQLSGKVDRVDGWVHDGKLFLRVVDYKTGKKAFDLNDIRYGLGVQMLLYLEMLRQHGKEYFGYEIEPSGVLYFPAREVILSAPRGITDQQLRAAVDKELRRSGLVLGEPEVLQAMEHSALTEPRYLPLRISRGGDITGSIASAEQLGKLGRYVEELLHRINRDIWDGKIDADPCKRGGDDTACTYCPFASACQFEEGRGSDKFRYIETLRGDAFWSVIDREVGELYDGE